MQTITQAEFHLLDVMTERSVSQGALEKAKLSVMPYFTKEGVPVTTSIQATSQLDTHLCCPLQSQQVLYPNDPLHPDF